MHPIFCRKWGFPVTSKRQVCAPRPPHGVVALRGAVEAGGQLLRAHMSLAWAGPQEPFLRRSAAEVSRKLVCVPRGRPGQLGGVQEAGASRSPVRGLDPLWDWNPSGNPQPHRSRGRRLTDRPGPRLEGSVCAADLPPSVRPCANPDTCHLLCGPCSRCTGLPPLGKHLLRALGLRTRGASWGQRGCLLPAALSSSPTPVAVPGSPIYLDSHPMGSSCKAEISGHRGHLLLRGTG